MSMRLKLVLACCLFLLQAQAVVAADTPVRATTAADDDRRRFDAMIGFLRERNAKTYQLHGARSIDESKYVMLGGIQQWVTIRGVDRNNPVLLLLHGGPGDATNPWSYAFLAPWFRQFTVVQWDQRGAGRTFRKTGASIADTMTIGRMVDDGVELAGYLRTSLHKDRIILVGHSWGSILGALMAQSRPDLFHAFVATGQVVDGRASYRVAYDRMLEKARATGNQQALGELIAVGPPPRDDRTGPEVDRQWEAQHKWANAFEGAEQFLTAGLGYALVAPGSTPGDVVDWFDGQGVSGERLFPQTKNINLIKLVPRLAIPLFVFQGAEDFTTPAELARRYVDEVVAPQKVFVSIAGGGHFTVFMKSEQFLAELTARVRPLALKAASPAARKPAS